MLISSYQLWIYDPPEHCLSEFVGLKLIRHKTLRRTNSVKQQITMDRWQSLLDAIDDWHNTVGWLKLFGKMWDNWDICGFELGNYHYRLYVHVIILTRIRIKLLRYSYSNTTCSSGPKLLIMQILKYQTGDFFF